VGLGIRWPAVDLDLGCRLDLDPAEGELASRARAMAEALHRLVARLKAVLGREVLPDPLRTEAGFELGEDDLAEGLAGAFGTG